MVNGFYLVSRDENKAKEVDIFRRLNPGVGIELVCFEDIIPMAADDGMLYLKGEKVACPDFVFVRAFKTRGKESQFEAVMNTLENLGAVCVNPIEARRMTTDKLLCFQVVRSKVPEALVPKTMLVTADVDAETVGRIIGFPLVLKVMHGSKGLGVTLVKDEGTLDAILNTVLAAPFADQLLAQQAIMSSQGRDVRVTVAFGQVIASYERVNEGSFRSNIHQGGHYEDFEPSQELADVAVRISDALGLKMGGIDFLFGEGPGEFWFCEANSLVGLSEVLKANKNGDLSKFSNYSELWKMLEK